MARFDFTPPEPAIAEAILSAPGWCRVGITMPDVAMRERAAHELARAIVAGIEAPVADQDQLHLAL